MSQSDAPAIIDELCCVRIFPGVNSRAELVTLAPGLTPGTALRAVGSRKNVSDRENTKKLSQQQRIQDRKLFRLCSDANNDASIDPDMLCSISHSP